MQIKSTEQIIFSKWKTNNRSHLDDKFISIQLKSTDINQ